MTENNTRKSNRLIPLQDYRSLGGLKSRSKMATVDDNINERAANLEALAEEDDVLYMSEVSDEGDDTGGKDPRIPNQFDSLCDGVHNNLALVHGAMAELLELKDELLKQSLPPNVLTNLAITTTRVYRSVSDMHMPVNELVRLVHLYSTPWDEKSTALKKLHEDYEAKKTQLNIALKRLEMIDAYAKKVQREKLIMNWERVFARLTAAKGHGRRWKFLISSFKNKASQGIEYLQSYLRELDESSDEESEAGDDEPTQMQLHAVSPSIGRSSREEDEEKEEAGFNDDEEVSVDESGSGRSRTVKSALVASEASEHGTMVLRPPMKDKECWTHEPEYDRFLHVRVYTPEGLEYRDLKCVINCGKEIHKTGLLDSKEEPVAEPEYTEDKKKEEVQKKPKKSTRGRGLIGTKGSKGGMDEHMKKQKDEEEENNKNVHYRYEECKFYLPEEAGIRATSKVNMAEHLRIAVHFGPREEIVAMATINMDDLDSLDLPVVYLPGDEFVAKHEVDESNYETCETESVRNQSLTNKQLEGVEPVAFPLYPLHVSHSADANTPAGSLPLVCFWAKRLKPRVFNRFTESETVNEIVFDETGFDMTKVHKDDLHKEMKDEALSVVCFTPEVEPEETVPKSEFDHLAQKHREEMQILQDQYEKRLQDLAENLQQMEEAQEQLTREHEQQLQQQQYSQSTRARSRSPSPLPTSRSHTPAFFTHQSGVQMAQPVPRTNQELFADSQSHKIRIPSRSRSPQKNFKVGKALPNWGEHLPKDFLERLRFFEEETERKRAELKETLEQETRELYEKKLAGQYKISDKMGEDTMDPLVDVSLPAVFMPTKNTNMMIFNPRANKYFHPTGSGGSRLTQPPSMLQLPPLPKNKVSVVNLFDMSQKFHKSEQDWLMQKYLSQQTIGEGDTSRIQSAGPPKVPTHSYASMENSAAVESGSKHPSQSRESTQSAPTPFLPSPPKQEVTLQS